MNSRYVSIRLYKLMVRLLWNNRNKHRNLLESYFYLMIYLIQYDILEDLSILKIYIINPKLFLKKKKEKRKNRYIVFLISRYFLILRPLWVNFPNDTISTYQHQFSKQQMIRYSSSCFHPPISYHVNNNNNK